MTLQMSTSGNGSFTDSLVTGRAASSMTPRSRAASEGVCRCVSGF
jgi:hypothetical protein